MTESEAPEIRYARTIDYQAFFDTKEGSKVLHDLIWSHYMGTSFTMTSPDPLALAYKEGERNVVIRILAILNTDVEKLRSLLKETMDGRPGRKLRHVNR